MEFSVFILLFAHICCFENKLLNFPEKIFLRGVEKIKNVPPQKETRRIVYKKQKRPRKEKERRNLKGLKISALHEAQMSTVPSQIVGWIRSWNI
jgi:hypothetical protein